MTSIIINYPDEKSWSKVLLNPSDPTPLKIWKNDKIELKYPIVFQIEDSNGDEQHISNLIVAQEVVNLSIKTDVDTHSEYGSTVRGGSQTQTPARSILTPNRERSELDGMSESENDSKVKDGKLNATIDTDIEKEDTDIDMT